MRANRLCACSGCTRHLRLPAVQCTAYASCLAVTSGGCVPFLPGRLIGVSVLQSCASAVLAPSLRHVADMLALNWRARLTRSALAKYLAGEAAGQEVMVVPCPLLPAVLLAATQAACRAPLSFLLIVPHACRQHVLHQLPAGGHAGHRPAADAGHWWVAQQQLCAVGGLVCTCRFASSAGQLLLRACSPWLVIATCFTVLSRLARPFTRRAAVRRPGGADPHPGQAGGGHLLVLLAAVAPHRPARHGHPLPVHRPGLGLPQVHCAGCTLQ